MHSTSSDSNAQGAGRWAIAGQIELDGTIELNKGSDATATGVVSYQIVSCDAGEFTVQLSEVTMSTSQATNTGTITPVDIARTFIIGSRHVIGTPAKTVSRCAFPAYELTDATTLTVSRSAHHSIQLRAKMQAVTWAAWTGVLVYNDRVTLNGDMSSKISKAHGVANIDPSYTWLVTSMMHQTSGLEQCSVAANLLDSSGVASSTNIYFQRYDQVTSYTTIAAWFLIRFPDNSITISNVDSTDSGTGTLDIVTPGIPMYPDGVIYDWTNATNGTGTAFARHAWYFSGIVLLTAGANAGKINYVSLARGYSGLACVNVSTFIDLGNFKPQNPSMALGVNF